MQNDKGQWLCGYIGLKHEQELDFNKLENEVCIAPIFLKKLTLIYLKKTRILLKSYFLIKIILGIKVG
ncbi:hypothetical protein ACTN5O_001123 [Campylobacter jejuni]|nr:hypothetical protein [Campylobacter jejuni]EEO6977707.1 hypothetical protein [Campylobacter jejuni]